MGKRDYYNSLLFRLPDKQIKKLQRGQNAAARLISYTPWFGHITPVLRTLHWLPIRFRIEFKMLVIIFKSIHGLSPVYISDLTSTKLQSKYCLRSNNVLLLAPKVTKLKRRRLLEIELSPQLHQNFLMNFHEKYVLGTLKLNTY